VVNILNLLVGEWICWPCTWSCLGNPGLLAEGR